jgi:hypothetical protein
MPPTALVRDFPRSVRSKPRAYGIKRSFPITSKSVTSKQPRVQVDAIQVGLAPHSRDGVMFGTFEVDNLHRPLIRVGIVARQGWSPWEYLTVSRGWTVVWLAEDSPMELTSSRVSFDSLSLQFFIRSHVSLILTDGRLPGPTSFWWDSTSPLLLAVGIRMPNKRSYYTSCWHHQIIPWAHSSRGGVSAATGKCHVSTHMSMETNTVALPCLPLHTLSSVFSTTVGGQTFKAPHKAEWSPRDECLTTTTWHSGGLLPSFTHGVAVAAIDVRSHTNWVRRALQPGELITAFEIPAGTQATFAPEVIAKVCASLPSLTPGGVLRVLLSILVPLKGRIFTGGVLRWRSCLPGRRWPC